MPWLPELFTAPALQQLLERRWRQKLVFVPFFLFGFRVLAESMTT
jgi:hypothetical protein